MSGIFMSVMLMDVVQVRYDYAYGNFAMGAHIPPRANMIIKVKLVEINSMGRLQFLTRIAQRIYRFTRRVTKRNYKANLRWSKTRPVERFWLRFFRVLGILPPEEEEKVCVRLFVGVCCAEN